MRGRQERQAQWEPTHPTIRGGAARKGGKGGGGTPWQRGRGGGGEENY